MTDFTRRYILTSIDDIKTVASSVLNGVEERTAVGEERRYEIALVINELLVNCFKHASASADQPVALRAHLYDGNLSIRVTDSGKGFEYEKSIDGLQNPAGQDTLYKERGRGLTLVKALCQEIKYNCIGNSVEVIIVL